jgi:hypothetical protein
MLIARPPPYTQRTTQRPSRSKAVPEFVAMGYERRIEVVYAKASAACGWSVLALEMLALDKTDLVERVIAADLTTAGAVNGMMNELQAAIEAGDCLVDTMKWAQARLVGIGRVERLAVGVLVINDRTAWTQRRLRLSKCREDFEASLMPEPKAADPRRHYNDGDCEHQRVRLMATP